MFLKYLSQACLSSVSVSLSAVPPNVNCEVFSFPVLARLLGGLVNVSTSQRAFLTRDLNFDVGYTFLTFERVLKVLSLQKRVF